MPINGGYQKPTISKNNTFTFNAKTTNPILTQEANGPFVFGKGKQILKVPKTAKSFKNNDDKKHHPSRAKRSIQDQGKQICMYICDAQTRNEDRNKYLHKHNQIKILSTEFLKKKFLGSSKTNKKRMTSKKQATTNTKKTLTRKPYKLEKEESRTGNLGRRQLPSPVFMLVRLRSNSCCKPGD